MNKIWKVSYVHPDRLANGSDKFDTKEEAETFAKSLRAMGYHDVEVSEVDDL